MQHIQADSLPMTEETELGESEQYLAEEGEVKPLKPLAAIQDILVQCEPSALLTGVVVLAEWIDEDGDASLGVIATPMSPWHMASLFEYVKDNYCAGVSVDITQYVDEFGDEDEDEGGDFEAAD